MKLVPVFLLAATAAQGQLPDSAQALAASFWPQDAATGFIRFTGVPACADTSEAAQRAHVAAWVATNCASGYALPPRSDSAWVYVASLDGFREGMLLQFVVRLSRRPTGWHYLLGGFQVHYQTGITPILFARCNGFSTTLKWRSTWSISRSSCGGRYPGSDTSLSSPHRVGVMPRDLQPAFLKKRKPSYCSS